ncbi:MAG TPA: lyase [Burkholderiaceae bacterium]|nr:lyase [Burkholderiaceae bacterium]
MRYYDLPRGARPHDVAPDPRPGGPVWYTAQGQGALGMLDPASGEVVQIELGPGSAPHGVIIGPDGAPWVTDGGLNAILRVDPATREVKRWALPKDVNANLNTASFDADGKLWFTGQAGIIGRLDPASGRLEVWKAPRGRGPYGITTTPAGEVYFASLAGNYIAHIDRKTGAAAIIEPPTPQQGARRVWSDAAGRIWVAEWNSGKVGVYDPEAKAWKEWKLPGDAPRAYAVWVDERGGVWLTDFAANAIVRFDPKTQAFESFPSDRSGAMVRQLLGRTGEVWGAESGNDRLVVIKH